MILDIQTSGMPPQVGLLWGQIVDGARRLRELVAGMSQEEMEYRGPTGTENSTATLLAHLAVSDLGYARHFFGTEVPADVKAAFGPSRDENKRLPVVTGVSLEELLNRIATAQSYLKQGMDALSDANLDRVLPSFGGNEATLRWMLWHAAGHSILHQGHIRSLKRQWQENR